MPAVHFSRVFAAAHRVWNDDSKCRNVHGHNYRVEVDVSADHLNDQGFVVPFDAVKDVIDRFDHALILDAEDPLLEEWPTRDALHFNSLNVQMVEGVPSTEFMAQLLADGIARAVIASNPSARFATVHLELRETDGIQASASVNAESAELTALRAEMFERPR